MILANRIAVMRDGKILQFDLKDRLYNKPSDLFVATFIGSPPMNIIYCSLRKEKNKIYADAGETKFDITDLVRDKADQLSEELAIGFRPEFVEFGEVGFKLDEKSLCLKSCKITLIERIGDKNFVHMSIGDKLLIGRTRTSRFREGDFIDITVKPEHIHIFDGKSGKAII
jgi:ABC-type sugar transport system ATPase subunit